MYLVCLGENCKSACCVDKCSRQLLVLILLGRCCKGGSDETKETRRHDRLLFEVVGLYS